MISNNEWRKKHGIIASIATDLFKKNMNERLFTSHFGVSSYVCTYLFHCITNQEEHCNFRPMHLLMSLHFLKAYNAEGINATLFRCSEKTLRQHCWNGIKILSNLALINWEDRNLDGNEGNEIRISIDGTDCPIQEPSPFSPKWFIHKFKGPDIRYELGVAINGNIVWVYGGSLVELGVI